MHTISVLVLTAAAASGQLFGRAHAFGPRAHAIQGGPAPPGGAMTAGAAGCQYGHAGCLGGSSCPGASGGAAGAAMAGRRFPNTRSQIFFVDPPGMKIGWQTAGPNGERIYLPGQLTVPARYNFNQGYIYRLKLTDIPGHAGLQLYPTIEVAPSTPATDAYLTHNPIPAQFTEEDFDQVTAGNFVTKVIYLPDPKYQELAIAGVETLVSTRLEPGVDPVLEADRRGTILMIIRVGAIDLEMPNAATAGAAAVMMPGAAPGTSVVAPGTVLPPGMLPPGATGLVPGVTPAPAIPPAENVPVDNAPVSPAPTTNTPPAAPTEPPAANPPAAPAESPAQPRPGAAPPDAPANPPGAGAAPADVPAPQPPADAPKRD
jgi:hypothetical protein